MLSLLLQVRWLLLQVLEKRMQWDELRQLHPQKLEKQEYLDHSHRFDRRCCRWRALAYPKALQLWGSPCARVLQESQR